MPKIAYRVEKFGTDHESVIVQANKIIDTYRAEGYDLTLRQLYYQFVARGLIANKDTEYKRLGGIVQRARYAGRIDWNAIVDRTRNLRSNSHWSTPEDIIRSAARSYAEDKWEGQNYRPEVWVEKDALIGVVEQVAKELDVPCFSCRGYTSASEVWGAAQRHIAWQRDHDQFPFVIHLGDHDPSGIDMSRDIQDRLTEFCEAHGQEGPRFTRIALNMDQVEQYNPPPNPAKITDSRATKYIANFGDESWELDALEPQVLAGLIRNAILNVRDDEAWEEAVSAEEHHTHLLEKTYTKWDDVTQFLSREEA